MGDVTRFVGLCETMCPVDEFEMRQREGLLHKLELPQGRKPVGRGRARLRGDLNCAVKEYSRPAAGRAEPDPTVLRPPRVLHKTVNFLFNTHIKKQHSRDPEWNVVYDFVFDRLRAVRQDMVIQNISGQDAITILEACVRFHVYAGYRMCEHGLDTFDPVINHHHTLECLKRLLYLYSQTDIRQMEDADTQETEQTHRYSCRHRTCESNCSDNSKKESCTATRNREDDLESRLKGLSMGDPTTAGTSLLNATTDIHRHQAEFESVYLLYNLGDHDAIRHYLNLPKSLRNHRLPDLAYQISISYLLGNTLRVLRLASSLPSLLALCAFHRHLHNIQRHGLKIMCTAYSSKNTRFPLSKLSQLIGYDSETEAERACVQSGLHVLEGKVCFQKSAYLSPEKVETSRWEFLEEKMSPINISKFLLGNL